MKQLAINQGKTDRRARSNGSTAAKAVVRRNIEEVQGNGRFDVFEELFADDFVDHTPQPNMTPDKAGVRKLYGYIRDAFPDFHAKIHWQLADGDCVTTYKTYYGTHEGSLLGVAPTHRKIYFESVDVMRVRNGKITDHWGVGNFFSLMQQLGALPVTTDGNGSESAPRRARLPPKRGKQHENAREKSRRHQRCKYTNSELLKKQGPTLKPEAAGSHSLDAIFDAHIAKEFVDRDVDATMATMVTEPYVHCVPLMTGGSGSDGVRRFYSEHFVNQIPKDAEVTPVSRTIGKDQVVDELIVSFTHDTQWDYLLPGIPPTGKRVEIPHVVVMKFENGKVAHEHVWWDQASVLVQVGLLDPAKLPVAGVEQARELLRSTRGEQDQQPSSIIA